MSDIRFMADHDGLTDVRSAWDEALTTAWLRKPEPSPNLDYRTRLILARHRARQATLDPQSYGSPTTTNRGANHGRRS